MPAKPTHFDLANAVSPFRQLKHRHRRMSPRPFDRSLPPRGHATLRLHAQTRAGQGVRQGAAVLTVGWVFGSLFTTMSVNGALAAVSDHTYDGVLFSTDFTAMFGLLALGVVGAAFQIGERLQRDTEGLV